MNRIQQSNTDEITAPLMRGCDAVYSHQELQQLLETASKKDRPLRIKLGLDPTAPDIHLGHTVVLRKMRQFQDLGHKAVLIVGDYTARIGDPSGTDKTRPELPTEKIEKNAATYLKQAGKILDTSSGKLEVRRNSEWLDRLTPAEILKLAGQITVARLLERDSFQKRYKAGTPIGLHEFLYPLMQGYDSVVIKSDVELGGTDQTFNNLVGRDIQRAYGQSPQVVMVMPLLVGVDGVEKMSKSKGNYIGVTEPPGEMFGKVMSIPDMLLENYFTLLTDTPMDRIAELVDANKTHPRDAKVELGKTIVAEFHSPEAADKAAAEFEKVFAKKDLPSDMPQIQVSPEHINIVELIMTAGFAESKSKARRLVSQKAVSIDGRKVTDIEENITPFDGMVLKVGKRRFGRISVK